MNELLIDENEIGDVLTPKQELFCVNYSKIRDTFGNATLSYADAYNIDISEPEEDEEEDQDDIMNGDFEDEPQAKTRKYKKSKVKNPMYDHCASSASRLLRNVKINKRITELLNEMLTDDEVDAELATIIKGKWSKNSDRISAIKEYNKLRQRIIEKQDITSGGKTIEGFNFIRADEPKPAVLPEPVIIKQDEPTETGQV